MSTNHLTVQQAADYLGLSVSALNKWRVEGKGPAYRKLGKRVFYPADDLRTWAEAQTYRSTSEYVAA
jgi:excisionase family DNA binding protein